MAKGGIYKSEVLRARDKILAEGRYPSIDAVRIELGNTGSKGTIHRYLKEIEEEEGGPAGTKVAVSDAIQDLVGRLASRLHEEADARIAEAGEKYRMEAQQQADSLAALRKEADGFRADLERTQLALADEQSRHEQTATKLQAEALERAQLAQQVADMQERLAAEERHRQSLEEKHQHAREALEHFRQSAKDQREQEQRQHEQQVQYLQGEAKALNQSLTEIQHEVIHLNQENARLTSDIARAETELHKAQAELRHLKDAKEQLAASERQADELRRQVVTLQASLEAAIAASAVSAEQVSQLAARIQALDIELASAKAARSAQDELAATISGYLAAAQGGKLGTKGHQEKLFKS